MARPGQAGRALGWTGIRLVDLPGPAAAAHRPRAGRRHRNSVSSRRPRIRRAGLGEDSKSGGLGRSVRPGQQIRQAVIAARKAADTACKEMPPHFTPSLQRAAEISKLRLKNYIAIFFIRAWSRGGADTALYSSKTGAQCDDNLILLRCHQGTLLILHTIALGRFLANTCLSQSDARTANLTRLALREPDILVSLIVD